ncbi:hypothetical protein [Streptomyces sp. NPDC001985]|uniref:hypothetical protein n=1 Tax=Streptomyces sp. NPDC001985 TaxID=3154406 RepID=UPI003318D3A9
MVTGVVAAGALTGCTEGSRGAGSAAEAERVRAAAAARRRAAAASGALRDRYDATIARHPGLAARLTALRASVAEHITALGGAGTAGAQGAAGPSARVPAEEPLALAALADAERRTADVHSSALETADPEFARLLASLAAAGAAHAYLLTEDGPR